MGQRSVQASLELNVSELKPAFKTAELIVSYKWKFKVTLFSNRKTA
jgi:hypothetical protein